MLSHRLLFNHVVSRNREILKMCVCSMKYSFVLFLIKTTSPSPRVQPTGGVGEGCVRCEAHMS